MNVMAKAHSFARTYMNNANPPRRSYKDIFKNALRHFHKEYKAMQKEVSPVEAWKAQAIKDAEKRIAELKAIDTTDGFIVVVGDNIRLPLDEVQGKWCKVERASIFWHREDAQRFAGRVRNGNNEVGQVVKKIDQIAWEITEQEKLIESLKNSF
ncbi:hypothetical protein [Pseudomonas phage COT4]|uniref:Uncharacterized protein n=1 Tax=Pseudomonas phage M5.1 TaxID=2873460 RepID=A0AAE9BP04_9CAUD|nr:hypothetical protein QGX13_gp053 [Pseudomonas phage M5.1]UAV89770.1 hypothetical protein M51_189 [Pseudomonas phage M5.1]UGL61369.1 hypothetical protein [Pseudomonas phage COT4]